MSRDAIALCTDCGLCCDGTLYGRVLLGTNTNLHSSEEQRLTRRGLLVLRDAPDGPAELQQPCTALRGALCDVYDDRPSACARYACALRVRVASGSAPLAEAKDTVTKARGLVSTIRRGLDLAPGKSLWQGIDDLERPPSEVAEQAWAEAHAPSLEAVRELVVLLRDAFEPNFAGASATRTSGQ